MQQPTQKEMNPQSSGMSQQPLATRSEHATTTTTTTITKSQEASETTNRRLDKKTGNTGVGRVTFKPIDGRFSQYTGTSWSLDPYCKFKIGWRNVKSEIYWGTRRHAEEEDDLATLKVSNQEYARLKVKDRSKMIPDNLGVALIPLAEVFQKGSVTKWIPIAKDDKVTGEVQIEMTFIPKEES